MMQPKLTLLLLITTFALAPPLTAQNISTYLQADFNFINGSLEDSSPNQLHAEGFKLEPEAGIEGRLDAAFLLDEFTSYLQSSTDNRNITDQVTLSAWIKSTHVFQPRTAIVSKYNPPEDAGYMISLREGIAALSGRDGSGSFYEISSVGIRIDDLRWHHVAGVIDGNVWKLYVDCYLVDSLTTTTAAPQFANNAPLTIGRLSYAESGYFGGVIDNVKLYNKALSHEELQEISPYTCPDEKRSLNESVLVTLAGGEPSEMRSIAEMPGGDLIMVGAVKGSITSQSQADAMIFRCSRSGEIRWSKVLTAAFTSQERQAPRSVERLSDGSYMITGSSLNGFYGGEDIVAFKIDEYGNISGYKAYGGAGTDLSFDLVETTNGDVLLVGSTTSYGTDGVQNAFVVSINPDGESNWYQTFSGPGNDELFNIHSIGEDTFLVSGITDSYGSGGKDFMIMKMDDQGNFLSGDTYGSNLDELGLTARPTPDQGYLLFGHSTAYGLGGQDGVIVKVAANGNIQWSKAFGGALDDFASDVLVAEDGSFFLSGSTASSGAGMTDLFLIHLSPQGALLESRTYGEPYEELLSNNAQKTLLELKDGRIIMLGTSSRSDGYQGVRFHNFATSRDDLCMGQDWDANIFDIILQHNTFTPAAEQISGQFGTQRVYVLPGTWQTSHLQTSGLCPENLTITEHSTACSYQAANTITTSGPINIQLPTTFLAQSFTFLPTVYKAGNSIRLMPGFQVSGGQRFSAVIEDCSQNNTPEAMREHSPAITTSSPTLSTLEDPVPVKLFPNPARDYLQVQVELRQDTRASLWLQNTAGQVLYRVLTDEALSAGTNSRELDLGHLPAGMYFLRFWTAKESYVAKFLKVD